MQLPILLILDLHHKRHILLDLAFLLDNLQNLLIIKNQIRREVLYLREQLDLLDQLCDVLPY